MRVADIFRTKSTDVLAVYPENTIAQVARVMADYRIGLIVACTEGGRVVGVLSERDIVRAVADYGAQVPELLVDHILTRDPITCTMDDDPKDVLRIMNEKGFRHMPVVEHGTLKGLLSIKDVLKFMLEEATYQEKSSVWSQIDFI